MYIYIYTHTPIYVIHYYNPSTRLFLDGPHAPTPFPVEKAGAPRYRHRKLQIVGLKDESCSGSKKRRSRESDTAMEE